ncbi:hypothetical protein [Dyella caseinilytica]|uniref:Uncharacterized protein n=1 Tax=Dyella caseinilytica TaxID=1849581 RepID=A0ABX7H1B2_9GAMM|nr:hypothetical protein [Dyella caseinilytica]QRN56053.1 hypothetical protein ISN74_07705 [Dyella caseinilytica]GGA00111.1 hypothetical protein GCM10011408_21150 [Dyella caseinilytica]
MSNTHQRSANGPSPAVPATTTPAVAKASSGRGLTSERIASDIAAFNKAGGHIEVLGNTPFHLRTGKTETPASPGNTASGPKQAADKK